MTLSVQAFTAILIAPAALAGAYLFQPGMGNAPNSTNVALIDDGSEVPAQQAVSLASDMDDDITSSIDLDRSLARAERTVSLTGPR